MTGRRIDGNVTHVEVDYRTRKGREIEVLAQIELDGGLAFDWVNKAPGRGTALARLIQCGRVRHLQGVGSIWFQRYEIVEDKPPRPKSGLRRMLDALGARIGMA